MKKLIAIALMLAAATHANDLYYIFKNGTVAGTTVYSNGQHMGTTCTDGRTGGPALDCTASKK